MKNEPKNRPRTLKPTPIGEPRPQRHRKTQHSKHNNMDEKRSLRTNNHPESSKRTETLRTKLQYSQTQYRRSGVVKQLSFQPIEQAFVECAVCRRSC
jgi:hypothetical protein